MSERGVVISTLIRNARMFGSDQIVDLRIEDGRMANVESGLAALAGEEVIDAHGAALLPGLHDHHLHLVALAASYDSLRCGPPDMHTADELASLLRHHNAANASDWLRGVAYHPCIAGDIDRDWLDRYINHRPARIQHRGGRLWVLNSRALETLGVPSGDEPPGMEVVNGRATGRLYEGDRWLRERLNSRFPSLAKASQRLAGFGVTGITDTTPTNGVTEWRYFRTSQHSGQLHQKVRMMGSHQLSACENSAALQIGEYKVHLMESDLPDLDKLCGDIGKAHSCGRAVAIHCVTRTELIFALHALELAGIKTGDRIEHASVAPPEQVLAIRKMRLRVVTQPHFIAERGDQYLADVEPHDLPWMYRGAAFLAAGIPLAGGSDAPFGHADPWRAMRAAVTRKTAAGAELDHEEALTPEQALQLFLSPPALPGIRSTSLAVGSPADLCLLHSPWGVVRKNLSSEQVRCTWRAGKMIYCSG